MEAFYTIDVTRENLSAYLLNLAKHLDLKAYGEPTIFSPASGMGKEDNQGFDAFLPLIDSGVSAYIWSKSKFLSVVLYTCKGFDESAAIAFTENYFAITDEIVSKSF